jgi:hypothetical protein
MERSKIALWKAFSADLESAPAVLKAVVDALRAFLMPPAARARDI